VSAPPPSRVSFAATYAIPYGDIKSSEDAYVSSIHGYSRGSP
jgi:hypothetical protein